MCFRHRELRMQKPKCGNPPHFSVNSSSLHNPPLSSLSLIPPSLGRHGRPLVEATKEPLPGGVWRGGASQSRPGVGVRAPGWDRGQRALGKPVPAAQRVGAQPAGAAAAAAGAPAAGTEHGPGGSGRPDRTRRPWRLRSVNPVPHPGPQQPSLLPAAPGLPRRPGKRSLSHWERPMLYPSVAGRQNYNSQNSLGFGSLGYAPVRFQCRR